MRIAAFVDANGQLVGFYEADEVRVYDGGSGAWAVARTVPIVVQPSMRLQEVKVAIKAMAQQVECRVIVSTDGRGLINSVLQEELGFRTWKSRGAAIEQLDTVAALDRELAEEREQAAAEAARAPKTRGHSCEGGGGGGGRRKQHASDAGPVPVAERIAQGHYRFDLAAALRNHPLLNSRTALIPVLETTPFSVLDVACDHLPRWFEQVLERLGLSAETSAGPGGGVLARIARKAVRPR